MNEIGHNQPPDMTATAGETANDLSGWMADNPVIQTEEQAREAKVYIDRGSLCVKDLEDERKGKVHPLNEEVKTINNYYRGPRELLEGVVDELKSRMDRFLLREEAKRIAAAEEATRLAEQAERIAREAERKEREAIDEADSGTLGLDIAAVTAAADRTFADYQKAERQAALAERETKVKIGGGFTRAFSLKERKVFMVDDPIAAMQALKEVPIVIESLIKAARAYEKFHGVCPPGIRIELDRRS